jgi:hypothetical protein
MEPNSFYVDAPHKRKNGSNAVDTNLRIQLPDYEHPQPGELLIKLHDKS